MKPLNTGTGLILFAADEGKCFRYTLYSVINSENKKNPALSDVSYTRNIFIHSDQFTYKAHHKKLNKIIKIEEREKKKIRTTAKPDPAAHLEF